MKRLKWETATVFKQNIRSLEQSKAFGKPLLYFLLIDFQLCFQTGQSPAAQEGDKISTRPVPSKNPIDKECTWLVAFALK